MTNSCQEEKCSLGVFGDNFKLLIDQVYLHLPNKASERFAPNAWLRWTLHMMHLVSDRLPKVVDMALCDPAAKRKVT